MHPSSAHVGYRILDEPQPGRLARLSVDPFWIVLALMLGGGLIGWPWFTLNALAIGSATKRKEIALCALSFALLFAYVAALRYALFMELISAHALVYLKIALPAIKMGLGFAIYRMQVASFALYRHFGGSVKRAAPAAIVVGLGARFAVAALASTPFWSWVLL